MSDTTQEGVSEVKAPRRAHADMLAEIAARRSADAEQGFALENATDEMERARALEGIEKQIAEQPRDEHGRFVSPKKPEMDEDDPEPVETLEDTPQDEPEAEVHEPEPEDTAGDDAPVDAPVEDKPTVRMLKVKIDGVEQELPEDEVVKGFQMSAVGQARLREAARRQAELAEAEALLAQQWEQMQQQLQPQGHPQGQPRDLPTDAQGNIDPDAVTEALMLGDRNKVKDAVLQILSLRQPQQPQFDPNELVSEAVQKAKREAEFSSTMDVIGREFKAVFDDGEATDRAIYNTLKERAADLLEIGYNPAWVTQMRRHNPAELIEAHYAEQARGVVRRDLDIFRTACRQAMPQTQAASRTADKQAAKQQLQPPVNRAVARSQGAPAARPKTPAEIIAELKRARGQG